MKPRIVLAVLLLALIAPCVVAENVTAFHIDPTAFNATPRYYIAPEPITYPQEYYTLGERSLEQFTKAPHEITYNAIFVKLQSASWLESRRQTFLMERQNELLQEQVNLMKWQRNAKLTCTHYYNLAGACSEYAWKEGV